jgi:hypothetical protein
MKAGRRDRGATMTVFAPILAAIIGGGAAIGAAIQIVELAPSNSEQTPSQGDLTNQEVSYGDR